MDIQKLWKSYGWILLAIFYIVIIVINLSAYHLKGLLASTAAFSALLQTCISHWKLLRRCFRWLKYFIGFTNFKIDLTARFTVKNRPELSESQVKQFVKNALDSNNVDYDQSRSIDISRNKFGSVKAFIDPYSIYLTFSYTDAEKLIDGAPTYWLSVQCKTMLRHKSLRKVIDGIFLDIFDDMAKNNMVIDEKYTLKVALEDKSESFFKEQFIKEFKPDEIETFSIIAKSGSSRQQASHKELSIVSDKRRAFVGSVNDLLLRIS